jgi:uncharacterized protein involved in exopolysaccharide biosynthesis
MRRFTCFCAFLLFIAPTGIQAAPAPKPTNAKPAVINAGTEKNIAGVLENVVWGARIAVRENKDVADLPIVRRQKDWESWLKKNLRVERAKDTNLVRVSFQDGNAKEQAAIINVVVDHYLKNDIGSRRASLQKTLERMKGVIEGRRRAGKLTPEQAAKADKDFKKREEYIKTLPALVEPAKTP